MKVFKVVILVLTLFVLSGCDFIGDAINNDKKNEMLQITLREGDELKPEKYGITFLNGDHGDISRYAKCTIENIPSLTEGTYYGELVVSYAGQVERLEIKLLIIDSSEGFHTVDGMTIDEITGYITDYDNSYGLDITIPAVIDGIDVTGIDDNAFRNKGLKSVEFTNELKYIGDYAFSNNEITIIDVPMITSYLGKEAFSHNQLDKVTFEFDEDYMHSRVIYKPLTFFGNDNVSTVQGNITLNGMYTARLGLPLSFCEDCVFDNGYYISSSHEIVGYDISYGTDLVLPGFAPDGYEIAEIHNYVFYGKGITSVTFADKNFIIYEGAFENNNITDLVLPSTIEHIGMNAFKDNLLDSVTFQSTPGISEGAFSGNNLDYSDVQFPNNPDYLKFTCENVGLSNCSKVTELFSGSTLGVIKGYDFLHIYNSRIVDGELIGTAFAENEPFNNDERIPVIFSTDTGNLLYKEIENSHDNFNAIDIQKYSDNYLVIAHNHDSDFSKINNYYYLYDKSLNIVQTNTFSVPEMLVATRFSVNDNGLIGVTGNDSEGSDRHFAILDNNFAIQYHDDNVSYFTLVDYKDGFLGSTVMGNGVSKISYITTDGVQWSYEYERFSNDIEPIIVGDEIGLIAKTGLLFLNSIGTVSQSGLNLNYNGVGEVYYYVDVEDGFLGITGNLNDSINYIIHFNDNLEITKSYKIQLLDRDLDLRPIYGNGYVYVLKSIIPDLAEFYEQEAGEVVVTIYE